MHRLTRHFSLILGATALWLFFIVLHAERLAPTPYDPFGTSRFPWSVVFLATFLVSAYGAGLPEVPRSRAAAILSAVTAEAGALMLVSVTQVALGTALLPRAVLGGLLITWPLWSVLVWNISRDSLARNATSLMVIGDSDDVATLRSDLEFADGNFEVLSHLSEPKAAGRGAEDAPIVEVFDRLQPDFIVLDQASAGNPSIITQAAAVHARGARIRTMSLFYDEHLGKIPIPDLERVSLLFDIGEIHRETYTRSKRILDIVAGLVGTSLLLPLMLFVLIGNTFGNRGPLFYSQPRVGKGGKTFTIYKFRSMTPSSDVTWTRDDDARIGPFGRFLRRSHLDETPQVWNILRGELSLVGPRPEQPHYVEELEQKIPYYAVRHLVRPGLTGWAQVNYHYGASTEDAREKLQYDLYYLRHQSALLDLTIAFRTSRAVLLRAGK